jgi:N-acetyl-gamma-glutamyl-phosphate reductase
MIKVGIVGGTGYTGVELLRLLAQHPGVQIVAITSRGDAGTPVASMFPSLRRRVELKFEDPASANLQGLRSRLLRHTERRSDGTGAGPA